MQKAGITGIVESVLSAQREYADLRHRQSQAGVTIPGAFVRGIRHIGYRSTIEAIAELIDNSIQAHSLRVDLVFGYDESVSRTKPSQLAVIDDGHGMAPEMLRLGIMWGGTHRENDRAGLGRYGYGLPCSAVSMGRRFTVISKLAGGGPFAATFDVDALEAGKYCNSAGDVTLPPARPTSLPVFVDKHTQANLSGRMALWRHYPHREARPARLGHHTSTTLAYFNARGFLRFPR